MKIGDISPVDAAIRKLGVTQLNSNELRALAESKDKRAVSKLLEVLQSPHELISVELPVSIIVQDAEDSADAAD